MSTATLLRSFGLSKWRPRYFSSKSGSLCSKLAMIGGGKMAEAILSSLKTRGVQDMRQVVVYDVNEERLEYMKTTYGCQTSKSLQKSIDDAELIILAVKPQNVKEVTKAIETPPSGLILSIVAGLTIDHLTTSFRSSKVVRSMPNTPAMVSEGITVWIATKDTPPHMIEMTKTLLGSIGEQVEVSDERQLDMATAVSGSGPAYVFLTMEAMVDAAVHLGFPRDTAVKLVTATIRGSAVYAQSSAEDISNLRANVTSPGGTTASALYELEKGGFRTVVADAIWAAYRRALELGGNNPNVGPGRNKYGDSYK